MTLIEIIKNVLFRNMGTLRVGTIEIVRSGQPKPFRRWIIYKLTKPRNIINLAESMADSEDQEERKWASKKGIGYFPFCWGSGGPPIDYKEVDQAVNLASTLKSPVWIHCEGGKDRTGGLVGIVQARFNIGLDEIKKDWKWYGIPAGGWLMAIFKEIVNRGK